MTKSNSVPALLLLGGPFEPPLMPVPLSKPTRESSSHLHQFRLDVGAVWVLRVGAVLGYFGYMGSHLLLNQWVDKIANVVKEKTKIKIQNLRYTQFVL